MQGHVEAVASSRRHAECYSVQFQRGRAVLKGRGKRGNSVWVAAARRTPPARRLVSVSAIRFPRTESRQMSQRVFAALFDKHPLASVVQDGRFQPTSLAARVFPWRRVAHRGKSISRRRLRRLCQPMTPTQILLWPPAPPTATRSPHQTSFANFPITSESRVTAKLVRCFVARSYFCVFCATPTFRISSFN